MTCIVQNIPRTNSQVLKSFCRSSYFGQSGHCIFGFRNNVVFRSRLSALRPTPAILEDRLDCFLVWVFVTDQSGMGGPTSSYATTSIAPWLIRRHKPHHHRQGHAIPRCGMFQDIAHYSKCQSKAGSTLVTLPRNVTPYRDSVEGTCDRVTYQKLVTRSRVPSTLSRHGVTLRGNVTSVDPALDVSHVSHCITAGEALRAEGHRSFRGEFLHTCMERAVPLSLQITPLDIKMCFAFKVNGTFTYLNS